MRIVHIYLSSMVPTAFRFTGSCTLLFYSPPLPLCLSDCPFHPQSKGLRKADGVFENNYIHSPSSVISRSLSEVPIYPIPSHHPESSHPTQQPLHPEHRSACCHPGPAYPLPHSSTKERGKAATVSLSTQPTSSLFCLFYTNQSTIPTNLTPRPFSTHTCMHACMPSTRTDTTELAGHPLHALPPLYYSTANPLT
jgi:hypothetical protein